jgi:hypothetical protein
MKCFNFVFPLLFSAVFALALGYGSVKDSLLGGNMDDLMRRTINDGMIGILAFIYTPE